MTHIMKTLWNVMSSVCYVTLYAQVFFVFCLFIFSFYRHIMVIFFNWVRGVRAWVGSGPKTLSMHVLPSLPDESLIIIIFLIETYFFLNQQRLSSFQMSSSQVIHLYRSLIRNAKAFSVSLSQTHLLLSYYHHHHW